MRNVAEERLTNSERLSVLAHSHEFELLSLCARAVIDSKTHEKIGLHLENAIDWDFLIEAAHNHRVLPLVYRTFADNYTDRVPKRSMDRLRNAFYANARRNLFLTAELFQVLATFDQHDIPVIPYKGPILAAALYGEVSFREFGDLDVIVPQHHVEKAAGLLINRGYKVKGEMSGDEPFKLHKRDKDIVLFRDDTAVSLELHWRISTEESPLPIKPAVLWENVDTISVGGKRVNIHAPEDLLLILCIHGGKHRWEHLGWLCDVAEIIRRYPELDWAKLMGRASSLGGRRVLLLGLLLAHNVLDAKLPNSVARQIEADPIVAELAEQVRDSLESETPVAVGETERYFIRLRERPVDRARVAMNQVRHYLVPTSRDRELFRLNGSLSAVLYVIRPFRLLWEYGMGPFGRFFNGMFESGSKKNELRKARLD